MMNKEVARVLKKYPMDIVGISDILLKGKNRGEALTIQYHRTQITVRPYTRYHCVEIVASPDYSDRHWKRIFNAFRKHYKSISILKDVEIRTPLYEGARIGNRIILSNIVDLDWRIVSNMQCTTTINALPAMIKRLKI